MDNLTIGKPTYSLGLQATYDNGSYVRIVFNDIQSITVKSDNTLNNYHERLTELQNVAIKNLHKTKKLLQLDLQLANGMVTETEYSNELNSNTDKYSIEMKPMMNEDDIYVINDIVRSAGIDENISVDEISEIFSIEYYSLLNSQGNGAVFPR